MAVEVAPVDDVPADVVALVEMVFAGVVPEKVGFDVTAAIPG
ncbi:hypothetical protein ACTMTI_33840 [Nonomuraea sp. H19]